MDRMILLSNDESDELEQLLLDIIYDRATDGTVRNLSTLYDVLTAVEKARETA